MSLNLYEVENFFPSVYVIPHGRTSEIDVKIWGGNHNFGLSIKSLREYHRTEPGHVQDFSPVNAFFMLMMQYFWTCGGGPIVFELTEAATCCWADGHTLLTHDSFLATRGGWTLSPRGCVETSRLRQLYTQPDSSRDSSLTSKDAQKSWGKPLHEFRI